MIKPFSFPYSHHLNKHNLPSLAKQIFTISLQTHTYKNIHTAFMPPELEIYFTHSTVRIILRLTFAHYWNLLCAVSWWRRLLSATEWVYPCWCSCSTLADVIIVGSATSGKRKLYSSRNRRNMWQWRLQTLRSIFTTTAVLLFLTVLHLFVLAMAVLGSS